MTAGDGRLGGATCEWPGCLRPVRPGMWGCREHWFALPWELRQRILAAHEPAQAAGAPPTADWLEAAAAARAWAGRQSAGRDQERLL